MWLTTRHEGFDGEKFAGREPRNVPKGFMDQSSASHLRFGILWQLFSLAGYLLLHFLYEGEGIFTFDMAYTNERMRSCETYRLGLALLAGLNLLGTLNLTAFQWFLADDVSWARGYRAGSKFLSHAVFFDLLSAAIQLAVFTLLYKYYDETSFLANFVEGNLNWMFNALARVFHAMAMCMYAVSFLLLEVYHDEGTSEWHGIINFFLCSCTAGAEILVLLLMNSAVSVCLNMVTLLSLLVWALAFEQEVNDTSPALCESELTNDVEQEVQKFARLSPENLSKFAGYSGGP